MSDKQDALIEIADIVERHGLTLDDIVRALTATVEQKAEKSGSILTRVFGYIGGILVFSGLCIFVSMMWDDMNAAGRIILTLGTGFSVFIMALVAITDERFERAATPLFLIAALLQPAGISVVMDEFFRGEDPAYQLLFMNLVMLIQQGLTFWARQRTVLAFTSIVFGVGFFAIAFDLLEIDGNLIGLVIGASLMCLAWALDHSRHKSIATVNYFFGSIVFLCALGDLVRQTAVEIIFLGASCGTVFLSTVVRSRTLLFVGTFATLGYIGYFTAKHFADDLGWPFILMLMGFVLIGMSAVAVKLNKKYIRQMG